jgi:large subunit ribosomal protein L24
MALTKRSKKTVIKNAKAENLHVKVGDMVMVISGKDKGKTGRVIRLDRVSKKLVVEGLNMMKKAVKPNPTAGLQGGIIEMEASLAASKVMLYSPQAEKPTRIKKEIKDGKKVRVCKHTGAQLD